MDKRSEEYFKEKMASLENDKKQLEEEMGKTKDKNSNEYKEYESDYKRVNDELKKLESEKIRIEKLLQEQSKTNVEIKKAQLVIESLKKRKEECMLAIEQEEKNGKNNYVVQEYKNDLQKIEEEIEKETDKEKNLNDYLENIQLNLKKFKKENNIKEEEENQQDNNQDTELDRLKKELKDVAEQMRKAKKDGRDEDEVALHSRFNELAGRIKELEKENNKDNNRKQNGWEIADEELEYNGNAFDKWGKDEELDRLKKELKDVAEQMREAKRDGRYEDEVALHSRFNELAGHIKELEKEKEKNKESNRNKNGWEIADEGLEYNGKAIDEWGNGYRKKDGDGRNGNGVNGVDNNKGGNGDNGQMPQPQRADNGNNPQTQPQPEQQKKLPRHWVEIMAATQTQSSGSIITNLHNMGKIHPLRMGPGIVFAPIKGIMKGFGMLTGDLIGRAEAKKREMRQNIENLSPEEFEILVKGLNETNMRQYKVNNIYLEAVHEVLAEREARRKQALIEWDNAAREAINQSREQIDEINRQLANPGLTNEQRNDLTLRLNQCILAERNSRMAHNAVYNEEVKSDMKVTDFERGMRGKSSQKMNIQGWFAARFNPDNRELHRQMADAYRERREAAERGDTVAESEAQRRIEQFKTDNTNVIQFLRGTRFETRARINRGLHTRETVHVKPSDADQNKGREMIAAIMAGVTMWNLAQTAHDKVDTSHLMDENQRMINQKINEHNKAIDSVNEHNRGVQSEIDSANQANGSIQGPDISQVVTDKQMRVAFKNEIHNNNMANHSVAHNGEFLRDNNGVGFNVNGSDDLIHAAQTAMRQSRVAAQKGSLNDLMTESRESYDRLLDTVQQEFPTAQQFMSVPGKSGFINSEYVINMQHLAPYEQTTAGLLSNIYNYFKSAAPIKGTQVTGNVQMAPYMDPVTLSNVVVDIPNHVLVNSIPFVAALANVMNMERQKAQVIESKNHDRERVILPNQTTNEQNATNEQTRENVPEQENVGASPNIQLPEDRIIRRRISGERNADNEEARPINVIYSDNRSRNMNDWGRPINQPEADNDRDDR